MTSLDSRLEALPDARRALFEALAGKNAPGGPAQQPPGPTAGGPQDALSFAQRRLWFVDQLHPGNVAYNVPLATRLSGPLDVTALHGALQAIVDRHTVLRTVYVPHEGEARPQVLAGYRVPLPQVQLVDPGPAALAAHLRAEAARPFDLATDAPLRTSLVALGDDEHVLMVTMHHIVTDGWSVRLFFDELAALYAARVQGTQADLPAIDVQYADFARWQRDRLQGERLEELLAFWKAELDGAVAVDLPTDRPRPAVFDHAGASYFLDLPADLVPRLRACGTEAGATLYMAMLAGFVATLARYTGQGDVTIGGSVAGRDHPAVAKLMGFFVNTVATRLRVDDDPPFRELLGRARRATLDAYAHQEMPFDLLVDALGVPRDPSRPPLTSVMFLLDETPDTGPSLPGLVTAPVDIDATAAKYDLMVNVHDTGDAVRALVEYPTALFDEETVRQLMGHYVTLLDAAARRPDARLSELDLLPRRERRTVLHAWNDTAAPLHDGRCLHELFEDQADRQPAATAVVCAGANSGRAISYAEVETRANQLAHHLAAAGVGPEVAVGLCLPRSADLVVAVLAVLKAGGAYVPLDPDYPPERLAMMLDDCQVPVAVTTSALRDRLAAGDRRLMLLDSDHAAIAAQPRTRPRSDVAERNLGYVIYTSGSTGVPKGIALEHRGVVNNLRDLNSAHGIGPGDAVLGLSSPSFDMSVYETLGMLGAGGTLVLPDPAAARDPAHWIDLIAGRGVTVWNSAPALLDLLLDQLEHSGGPALDRLRVAFLGGDWIPVAQPDRIRAFAPGLTFVALGGATEASIHSIEYRVGEVDPSWLHIPYGRPMANQRAYVLDGRGRPVPPGVAGELHLGGVGLARGYVNRPELTAERFVEVELEPRHRERLYRTGDLARLRRDGVIELLGRTDFRIKLNGLRIEPGEVEHALRAQPGVHAAVVVAQTPPGGRPRLVAFVVADAGARLDTEGLRAALAETLPPHAVPAVVVVLDALPLSPNGKVDRRALPDAATLGPRPAARGPAVPAARPAQHLPPPPQPGAAQPAAVPQGPFPVLPPPPDADPLVRRIVAAWRSVLGLSYVGGDDDFFALGGDSFAAVRAVRAIDEDLRVVELFTHATPRALAERIRQLEGAATPAAHTLIHDLTPARSPRLTFVCFPHGGGDAIVYRPLADALPADLGLRAVSPPGHDPAQPGPMVPLDEFAERCAEEIARTVEGPFAVYGHCAGVVAALETTRRLEDAGRRPEALYLAAALPEDDPAWSLEIGRQTTDEALVEHLRGMGGFDGPLDDTDLTAVVRMVRHDMTESARFFQRHPDGFARPLATPLTCLFGDADDATEGFAQRYLAWGAFVSRVDYVTIPGGGHYFAKHLPDLLAAALTGLQQRAGGLPTGAQQ